MPANAVLQSFEALSRVGWAKTLVPGTYPGDEAIHMGAALRTATAVERLQRTLTDIGETLLRIARTLDTKEVKPETPAERKNRLLAESKARTLLVYQRTLNGAGAVPPSDAEFDAAVRILSVRTRKALIRAGLRSAVQIAAKTREEMFEIRNCGVTTVNEIETLLGQFGFGFADAMLAARQPKPAPTEDN